MKYLSLLSEKFRDRLYGLFGIAILFISGVGLTLQIVENQDYEFVPDLFVGLDCSEKLRLNIVPRIDGRDHISIWFHPNNQPYFDSDYQPVIDESCSRLLIYSHEAIEKVGFNGSPVLSIPKEVYAHFVDLEKLRDEGDLFHHLTTITIPSRWPFATKDTRVFRLYLQEAEPSILLDSISKAFDDEALKHVTRQDMEVSIEGTYSQEVISSIPNVTGASGLESSGRSPPSRYVSVIPVSKSSESLVIATRDNGIRARREVLIIIFSTFFGLGLAIIVNEAGRYIRGVANDT